MDVTFWMMAAALTVVALALVVPPLLSKKTTADAVARDQINAQIFRERLAELEATGLSADEFEQAKLELEKNLAGELEGVPATGENRARWVALVAVVCVPAIAFGGYWWSSADTRAQQQQAVQMRSGEGMPPVDELVVRLRERLETETPDDVKGWGMLARSYLMLEQYQKAADTYAKLLELPGGQNPDVLADYAESLALANDEDLSGKPRQLLEQALQLDADHRKTLWLAGMAAMQEQQSDAAARHWQHLLTLLPKDSEDYQFLADKLAQMGRLPQDLAPAAQTEEPPAPVSVQVQVSLSAELTAQAAPEDTLFVYARAAQGPRMPLAIVRKQVQDLPLTVTLDDSMSMMDGMKLSAFPQVVLAARVSKSGNAMTQPGDLLGETSALSVSEFNAPVSVLIDQVTGE